MKSILLSLSFFLFINAEAQKFSLTSRANMNTAAGEQIGKFKNAYGLGVGLEIPVKKASPLKLMVNVDAGNNGMKSEPYEFEFRNVITKTSIDYSSNILELTTGLRYVFNESKSFKLYTGLSTGMLRYKTGYVIEDPEDSDGCHPLEAEKIQADKSFIGKVEGGLRFASPWDIGVTKSILFDIGVTYKVGTLAEFMRLTNKLSAEGIDYVTKFQTPTNEVHEHAIGKIYNTPVNQFGFHFGVILPFGF
jgi:hypothetical protein